MLIVKKFGGSSVANKERIFRVAERCIEDYRAGHDVVVVLSAMGDTTDDLIAMAHSIHANPKKRELDMLLTTGEQVSVSLMAMAMQSLDVPAVSLNAFRCRCILQNGMAMQDSRGLIQIVLPTSWIHERL